MCTHKWRTECFGSCQQKPPCCGSTATTSGDTPTQHARSCCACMTECKQCNVRQEHITVTGRCLDGAMAQKVWHDVNVHMCAAAPTDNADIRPYTVMASIQGTFTHPDQNSAMDICRCSRRTWHLSRMRYRSLAVLMAWLLMAVMTSPMMSRPLAARAVPRTPARQAGPPSRALSTRMPTIQKVQGLR